MSNKIDYSDRSKYVFRFSFAFRVAHWIQAGSFALLLLTGLPLWTEYFTFMHSVFGGPEMAQLLHRIFAVVFLLPLPILLFFDRSGLKTWTKELVSWKKHDIVFFLHFPKEFFVGSDKIPKQGFLNAGEKLNSIGSIVTTVMLIVSGFVIWFNKSGFITVSDSSVHLSQLIHVLGFTIGTIFAMGHTYLSAIHPNSKPSMEGITKGYIPVSYAKAHHERWYDELVESGEIIVDNKKNKGA